MLETKITTLLAEFVRIDNRGLPEIVLRKIVTRPDGQQKYVAMAVPIRDQDLLAQAARDLRERDQIEIKIETRWAEEGIPKTLLSFTKVAAPQGKVLAAIG